MLYYTNLVGIRNLVIFTFLLIVKSGYLSSKHHCSMEIKVIISGKKIRKNRNVKVF